MTYETASRVLSAVEPPTPAAAFAALVEEWVQWAEAYGSEPERELPDMRKRQHSGLREC